MFRTLAVKELREFWWMGLLATALIGLGIADECRLQFNMETLRIGRFSRMPIPFTGSNLKDNVVLVSVVLGLMIGFWQTLSESVQGTWLYLLHRPVTRRAIIFTKLTTGLLVLLVSTGLPLLVYLIWAMMPETLAKPFELWMTSEIFVGWLSGTSFYLGAFLCGIRPARWWVSRLWPLVPVFLVLFFFVQFRLSLTRTMFWITIVSDVILVAAILFAARHRDYA